MTAREANLVTRALLWVARALAIACLIVGAGVFCYAMALEDPAEIIGAGVAAWSIMLPGGLLLWAVSNV